MSRAQLAAEANMSVSSVRWHEYGYRPKGPAWAKVRPTESTLRALAIALNVPIEELRERSENSVLPARRKATALRLAAVFPSSGGDPYWALVLEGLRQALPDSWIVLAFPTGEDRNLEQAVLDQIGELGTDALVIAPAMSSSWPDRLSARGRHPIVVIDRTPDSKPPEHVNCVLVTDNDAAVSLATQRMITQGQVQRLACLAGPLALSSNRARLDAVRDVLGKLRPDMLSRPDDQWVPLMERPDDRCAEDALNRLFLRPDDEIPDGVICLNGKMTVGAFRAIRAQHRRIPDDIRFVGYDDGLWNYGLSCAEPPPSVIRQDPEQLGRAAARFVTNHRDGRQSQTRVYVETARFEPTLGGKATCDK